MPQKPIYDQSLFLFFKAFCFIISFIILEDRENRKYKILNNFKGNEAVDRV